MEERNKGGWNVNQVVVKQEKSGYQIVEAYKSLRTNLQFCGEDKKVIAVTSCTPNEGECLDAVGDSLLQRAEKE